MTDYKHVTRYPAHACVANHLRATNFGDALAVAVALGVLCAWAGYELGAEHQRDATAVAVVNAAGAVALCPPSNAATDILEHAWAYRGQIIYRECVRIERPVVFEPDAVPTVQTPALFQRDPK